MFYIKTYLKHLTPCPLKERHILNISCLKISQQQIEYSNIRSTYFVYKKSIL